MQELIEMEKNLTKDTFETLVYIQLSSCDNIVINLNTAFSALSYFISHDITQITEFCQIDDLVGKYNELLKKRGKDSIIKLHYNDEDGIAFSIIFGLKLKLEKELYTYV